MKPLKRSLLLAASMSGVFLAAFAIAKKPTDNKTKDSGKLRAAIETRFGKSDGVEQNDATFLHYKLANGDKIRFVLTGGESMRIEHQLDFRRLLGQRVTFLGTYKGPGKETDYIAIDGGSHIYFDLYPKKAKKKGIKGFGQRITATGTVRFRPGWDTGDPTKAGRAALYYLEDSEIATISE